MKEFEFEKICCICGCELEGFGNNPDPIVRREGAVCCNWCDNTVVIPARIAQMRERDREEKRK